MSNDSFTWMDSGQRRKAPRRHVAADREDLRAGAASRVERLQERIDELEAQLAAATAEQHAWRHPPSLRLPAWEAVPRVIGRLAAELERVRVAGLLSPGQWLSRGRWRQPSAGFTAKLRRAVGGLVEEALAGRLG